MIPPVKGSKVTGFWPKNSDDDMLRGRGREENEEDEEDEGRVEGGRRMRRMRRERAGGE